VRGPILVLAPGRDRGGLDRTDAQLFNQALNEILDRIQDDPELVVWHVTELLLVLDRAIESLAKSCCRSSEAVAYCLLPG
jgi:hypothetical protein